MSQGPMAGLKVVELSHERIAYAGKLFADMGADVVLVEPPGGDPVRNYPPFLEDQPGPGRSLWAWHYHTSKRSIEADIETPEGAEVFKKLVAAADLVLETEQPSADGSTRLSRLGLDYADIGAANPKLIWVSMTPFGRKTPRAADPATDLTLVAGSGMAWSCGYDDHSLPPVRGGGNQGYQTGCHYAVMGALAALLYRDHTGEGQYIDVNMNAAGNVTTEAGSYTWLVAKDTVQRQTGRHAGVNPSMPSQVVCKDGRVVNTGLPPRRPREFQAMIDWLAELGLTDQFPLSPVLELGAARERIDMSLIQTDPEVGAIFGAGRECVNFIASNLDAYTYFSGAQERGFQVGIIYSPEEVFEDPHFIDRGFPTPVEHPELGKTFTYPGAPYRFNGSPWKISRRAPMAGEHTEEVLAELGS